MRSLKARERDCIIVLMNPGASGGGESIRYIPLLTGKMLPTSECRCFLSNCPVCELTLLRVWTVYDFFPNSRVAIRHHADL